MSNAIEEYLDVEFAAVIEKALVKFADLDPVVRSGTIVGFLIKTGIAIAVKHGAPRKAIQAGVNDAMRQLYGK